MSFPISFTAFAASIRGTEKEIWTKIIEMVHSAEKHTEEEWHIVLGHLMSERTPAVPAPAPVLPVIAPATPAVEVIPVVAPIAPDICEIPPVGPVEFLAVDDAPHVAAE